MAFSNKLPGQNDGRVKNQGNGADSADQASSSDKPIGPEPKSTSANPATGDKLSGS